MIGDHLWSLLRTVDLSLRSAPWSVDSMRSHAQRRLPSAIFDFVDGGADDELTCVRNLAAFRSVEFATDALVDVATVDCSTVLFGTRVAAPIVLAPTGLTRLVHPDGELAVARSAARHDLPYVLSSMGSVPVERVGAASTGPKHFQLYVWRDRGRLLDLFERAHRAGFTALQLTVDVPVLGSRERDLRNGMTIPPRIRPAAFVDAARHPRWWLRHITSEPVELAAISALDAPSGTEASSLRAYVDSHFDPSVTWADLEWMVAHWPGAFIVKGVLEARVARRCLDAGVDGLVVSNHGGRQLDRAPASFDALDDVVQEVQGRVPILMDGGVRRGADVVAAVAKGAAGVQIGRPYLYGLGAYGEAGVDRVLAILLAELRRTMALLGRPTIASIDRTALR